MIRLRPARVVILGPLAGLLWSCGTERGSGEPARSPEPGRPAFEAEVWPDLQEGTLSARWRIEFLAGDDPSEPVAFLLSGELEIEKLEGEGIRSYGVEPFEIVPVWDRVLVELEDVEPGARIAMELEYSGRPAFPPSGINRISPEWVELNVDSGWHPVFASFDQEMTGVLRVELPEAWDLVAGGETSFEGGRHVLRITVPQLDVAFAAAPSLERVSSGRFTLLHQGQDAETVQAVLEAAESCAGYLDDRYGAEDPLPVGTLLLADRPGSAYARITYIVLSHVDPADPATVSRFLCHELAHYWSRGADPSTVHHWMSEAFAEYVAARFVRERFGQAAFDDLIARWEVLGRGEGPVWREGMTERGSARLMYRKAPVLLSRLEERIGSDRFDRFVERYMTNRVKTTPELLGHLEAVAGPEAVEAFQELLARGPEGPEEGAS